MGLRLSLSTKSSDPSPACGRRLSGVQGLAVVCSQAFLSAPFDSRAVLFTNEYYRPKQSSMSFSA